LKKAVSHISRPVPKCALYGYTLSMLLIGISEFGILKKANWFCPEPIEVLLNCDEGE
jgi:hypothetical protein